MINNRIKYENYWLIDFESLMEEYKQRTSFFILGWALTLCSKISIHFVLNYYFFNFITKNKLFHKVTKTKYFVIILFFEKHKIYALILFFLKYKRK